MWIWGAGQGTRGEEEGERGPGALQEDLDGVAHTFTDEQMLTSCSCAGLRGTVSQLGRERSGVR